MFCLWELPEMILVNNYKILSCRTKIGEVEAALSCAAMHSLNPRLKWLLPRFFLKPHGTGAHVNVYMFTPRSLARHAKTLCTEPRYFAARLGVMAYQLVRPDAPWLTAQSIRMLEGYLTDTMIGLEWGSGQSTKWFARRLRKLVSIEHDAAWHARISEDLTRAGIDNVDYRHLTGGADNPYVSAIAAFPDEYFDVILVDGQYRNQCLEAAVPKIKPGGLIVLDNADEGYFSDGLKGLEQRATTNGVWRTDLFFKPLTNSGGHIAADPDVHAGAESA
jgi:predicted O-methyltransferase YrrM